MTVLSLLRPALFRPAAAIARNAVVRRNMSGDHDRTMQIQPGRFQWNKFKDLLHYYIMLGVVPLGALIFFTNIYIGPATLADIPDDYVPQHWEYYEHPITRFMARYLCTSPQQEYEKYLHFAHQQEEKRRLRLLEWEIKAKIKERQDYKAYYYQPVLGKYYRKQAQQADDVSKMLGD